MLYSSESVAQQSLDAVRPSAVPHWIGLYRWLSLIYIIVQLDTLLHRSRRVCVGAEWSRGGRIERQHKPVNV